MVPSPWSQQLCAHRCRPPTVPTSPCRDAPSPPTRRQAPTRTPVAVWLQGQTPQGCDHLLDRRSLKSDKCCFVHWCLSFPCLTQQVVGNTRSQHTTHDQSSSAMIDCTRAWCCMPALPPQFCIPLHTMPRHPPLFPILKTLPFFPQARAHHCRVKLPTGRIPITFSWTAPTIAYRKIYGCLRGSVSRATLLEELAPLIRSMLLRFWGGII